MVLVGNYATRVKFYNLSCLKVEHQKLMKYVRLKQKGFRNLKKPFHEWNFKSVYILLNNFYLITAF